jgi:osmotically-inducible protein OsmY
MGSRLNPSENTMKKPSQLLLALGAVLATTLAIADGANAPSTQPALTITAQNLALDQRIQADVMNVLASNPSLSGRVAVESKDQVVNLSGQLWTAGQVYRAGRDAAGVPGVRYVVNEIRPVVGAVTN